MSASSSNASDCFEGISKSINTFCLRLYQEYSYKEKGNVFFSPFSIANCLAMVFAGARNNTASQMREVMKLDAIGNDTQVYEAFQNLLDHLKQSTTPTLLIKTANRIYVQDKAKILQEFQNILQEHFYSTASSVNFVSDVEKVRQEINNWVEEQTNNKIKDIISSETLSPNTQLVLVNAVYFSGEWKRRFFSGFTKPAVFHLNATDQIMVDMMYLKAGLKNGDNSELNCQTLELPFLGDQLSMFIILPKEIDGLEELERQLTNEIITKLIEDMKGISIHVYFPRFQIECDMELNPFLVQMGMSDLFECGKTDLSGLSENETSSPVSAAVHKAFLSVNEKGCEAAAGTWVSRALLSGSRRRFRADHPFLLLIRDKVSGVILFYGRLSCPPVSCPLPTDFSCDEEEEEITEE